MAEDFDVNEEYEKIFGRESRETLFSLDDEEYQALRQSIIEAKRIYDFKRLPLFDGVKLLSYEDFLRNEIVREAQSHGYRIFYIRKFHENTLYVYAAGIFRKTDSRFVVLKGAFFPRTDYFSFLARRIAPFARAKFTTNYQYYNGELTQKENYTFESASLAASYILGKKSNFLEWRDDRNRTLDAYYARFKSVSIFELEDRTFPDYVPPVHLFFIKKNVDPARFCDVSGFYDKTVQKFIMKSGSILSLEATLTYSFSSQGPARSTFLDKYCSKVASGYRLNNDYVFDTPSTAASYAIGRSTNGWTAWKDNEGNTLADIYRQQ